MCLSEISCVRGAHLFLDFFAFSPRTLPISFATEYPDWRSLVMCNTRPHALHGCCRFVCRFRFAFPIFASPRKVTMRSWPINEVTFTASASEVFSAPVLVTSQLSLLVIMAHDYQEIGFRPNREAAPTSRNHGQFRFFDCTTFNWFFSLCVASFRSFFRYRLTFLYCLFPWGG